MNMNDLTDEVIQNLISEYFTTTYIEPTVCFQLLCNGVNDSFYERHRRVLDQFSFENPQQILAFSVGRFIIDKNSSKPNNEAFQESIQFITVNLNVIYTLVFEIWVCLVFDISLDGVVNDTIKAVMTVNLPHQLSRLLSFNSAGVFCQSTQRANYNARTADKTLLQTEIIKITKIILEYSKLYKFLKQPYLDGDESVKDMQFSNNDNSLKLLLDVMIYKFFDTIHSFSHVMFDNYIILLKEIFNNFLLLFVTFDGVDTPMKMKMKIDAAMSHFAIFLIMTPNCSEILSVKMRPITEASGHLSSAFRLELNTYEQETIQQRHSSIFVTQDRSSGEQKQRSFFELEEMIRNRSKSDEVAREILSNSLSVTPFRFSERDLLSERTILNAVQLLVGICHELQMDFNTTLPNISASFENIKHNGPFPYMTFLNYICVEVDNICQKKNPSPSVLCDFSQLCCSEIPAHKFKDGKKSQLASPRPGPGSRPGSGSRAQPQGKSKYDQMIEKKQKEKEHNEKIAAARKKREEEEAAKAAEVKTKAEVASLDKEKPKLTLERIGKLKGILKQPVEFKDIIDSIRRSEYESAAMRLNDESGKKIREIVPWTADLLRKFIEKNPSLLQPDLPTASGASAAAPPSVEAVPSVEALVPSVEAAPSVEAVVPLTQASAEPILTKKQKKKLQDEEQQRLNAEKTAEILRRQTENEKERKDRLERRQAAEAQALAEVQAAAEAQRLLQEAEKQRLIDQEVEAFANFERNIIERCGGDDTWFEFIFKCSRQKMFKIINAVVRMSDEEIIGLLSSSLQAPPVSQGSCAAVAGGGGGGGACASSALLTEYMNIPTSRNCRAFVIFGILNKLRQPNNVRFVFTGRTFLQLLSCHSMLPPEKCEQFHITKETSDFDVYAIFNDRVNPMQYRELIVYIFKLFWNLHENDIHVHMNRNDQAWESFQHQPGHLYISPARAAEVMKVSKNNDGIIEEVSDFGFTTVGAFTRTFPGLFTAGVLPSVNNLRVLDLQYKLKKSLFMKQEEKKLEFDIDLDFEFPRAESGLSEALRIVIKILCSFVLNNSREFYFIQVSNLLKFLIRAIQYEYIVEFNTPPPPPVQSISQPSSFKGRNSRSSRNSRNKGSIVFPLESAPSLSSIESEIERLYREIRSKFHEELLLFLDPRTNPEFLELITPPYDPNALYNNINNAGLSFIHMLFINDASGLNIHHQRFLEIDQYRKTPKTPEGAAQRIRMPIHLLILNILKMFQFDDSSLQQHMIRGRNLFGGRSSNKYSNKIYTRKYKKQKMRKTVHKKVKSKMTLSRQKRKIRRSTRKHVTKV